MPLTLVKLAVVKKAENRALGKSGRDDNLIYDQIWCVFDVDEHPDIPVAKDLARANDIRLVISNPCIELWLLVHHREPPGSYDRHKIQEMLKEYVPGYDKGVNFADYKPGYPKAVKRAKQMAQAQVRAGTPGENPTTNFHELTELIAGSA